MFGKNQNNFIKHNRKIINNGQIDKNVQSSLYMFIMLKSPIGSTRTYRKKLMKEEPY